MKDAVPEKTNLPGKVIVVSLPGLKPMTIVPAVPDRTWMSNLEATDRWLPTSIANQAGWMLLNNQEIEITWNGGKSPSDLLISTCETSASSIAVSQFGNGIVTWKLPFLFHLPSETNLRLRGPTNWHREGVFPIEQVFDGDSTVVGVFMSWKMTTIGKPVRFELGEPLCMIYPELRGLGDEVDPQIHSFDGKSLLVGSGASLDGEDSTLRGPHEQKPGDHQKNTTGMLSAPQLEGPVDRGEVQKGESGPEFAAHSLTPRNRSNALTSPPIARSRLETFGVERDFYVQASLLRDQFERVMSLATSTDPTANPLTYVYSVNAYQFVGAAAEKVFSADLLFSFLDRLRAWARQSLGATHASTPRVQLYVGGSYRCFARDDIRADWHYLLSLARNEKQAKRISIFFESSADTLDSIGFGLSRVARISLKFNELLFHDAKRAYGISEVKTSTTPSEGVVLLDGYLW